MELIELKINKDENKIVTAIALVNSPAVEEDFLSFSDESFLSFSDDSMELLGCAMIPDKVMVKQKPNGEQFKCFFSKETIREAAQIFMQNGFQFSTNIEHSSTPADSFIFQSYIVDNTKGISAPKGINVSDGSWIVGVKVNSPKVWSEIKNGNLKGFSIEGFFDRFQIEFSEEREKISKQNFFSRLTTLTNDLKSYD